MISLECLGRQHLLSLRYSCHVLQSSLLTDPWRIYRNFIGQETKPGHISILRQVMTNKKYQSFVNQFSFQSMHQSNYLNCFHAELPYKDISPRPGNTSSSPQVSVFSNYYLESQWSTYEMQNEHKMIIMDRVALAKQGSNTHVGRQCKGSIALKDVLHRYRSLSIYIKFLMVQMALRLSHKYALVI